MKNSAPFKFLKAKGALGVPSIFFQPGNVFREKSVVK